MDFIRSLLVEWGLGSAAGYLTSVIAVLGIALLSILANFVAKKIVNRAITHYITKNNIRWGRSLLARQVFHKLSHVVPAVIIYYFSSVFPEYQHLIVKGTMTYMIIMGMLVIDSLLEAANDVYTTYEISRLKPIRGYIQVAKILLFIIGSIIIIANLMGESPVFLLSGVGAISAVVLLVFKDSLLGLVAGIQLTANDMVRLGDWIEMPKYGADGEIIDISLNTVKVQNWDKTITTIPSYALVSDSFKNWRGMQLSGGRRIKRSVFIDASSITFCTDDMLARFKSIHYLMEYIVRKEQEIDAYNAQHRIDRSNKVNGRTLTNIGVFRIYIQCYLRNHPRIHKGMTLMVRQLAPGETGLPLEIYAFTNDTNWGVYEEAQADIFDHIFAVAPEFGLRIFQNPTGHDMQSLNAAKPSEYRMLQSG